MSFGFTRGSTAILLCAFGASAAHADLTAQDVWSDWKAYLEGTGYELSATEDMSGGTLNVSNVALTMEIPDEDVMIEVSLGDLTFTENGDGTVGISLPSTMPINIAGTDEAGDAFVAIMNFTQTGFAMVAAGDPSDLTYNYTASTMGFNLGDVTINGTSPGPDFAKVDVAMSNVIGSTRATGSEVRSYSQNMQVSEVSYDIAINDPEEGGVLTWSGGSAGLELESVTALPPELDTENMAAMIEAGFAVDGNFGFGAGSSNLNFQDGGETFSYESSSDGGTFGFMIGTGGFGYEINQGNVSVNLAGSEFPLPISVTFAELVFDMLIPVMANDEPQDFDLVIGMSDFTISDLIWGIFDPTGQLPRDPATLLVSLNGKAKLLANIMDPEVAAEMENGPPPAELEALTVEELELTAAGASVTGSGDFTFDNTDLTTFDGMPRPAGILNLQLVGGNGLLDKLVAMGLLPAEEAGGVRMMMGLFARPGDGPDTLTSTLEINEEGHILANGQRIQ